MAIRTARAITREVPQAAASSIAALASCAEKNSERDAHRLSKKYKITLGLPLNSLKVPTGVIHYVKMSAWASFIMKHNLWHNLTGLETPNHDRCCAIWTLFWERYRKINGGHEVFQREDIDLSRTCALLIHGDEGRTLIKAPIMILSAHSVLGHGISTSKKRDEFAFNRMNFEHSTWTTRFLLSVLPRSFYKLDDGQEIDVFQDLLRVLTQDLRMLYETVVTDRSGKKFFFATIRVMGDWPFIVKAGCLNRSFQNVAKHQTSKASPKGICHRCCADLPGYPWEDLTSEPTWKSSINTLSPFARAPALLGLVVDPQDAPAFFEFDLFHTWHLGIGRTYLASAIIVFALSTMFEGSIDTRLETVTNRYLAWCTNNKISPVVRRFSKDSLSWPQSNVFPCGRWSKGAATTVISKWLLHECRSNRNDLESNELFMIVCDATEAISTFLSGLYKQDVWIKSEKASFLARQGDMFLEKYGEAVRVCFHSRRQLFMLMPNLHRLAHITDDMEKQSKVSEWVWNPLICSCQADEDYVGRPSRVSRRVSILQTIKNTLLRCMEAAYSHYVSAGLLIMDADWNLNNPLSFYAFYTNIFDHLKINLYNLWVKNQLICPKPTCIQDPGQSGLIVHDVLDKSCRGDIRANGKCRFWVREPGYFMHPYFSGEMEGAGIYI